MLGTMQDRPLTLDHFVNRVETYFPDRGIVTNTAAGLERTLSLIHISQPTKPN